MDTIHDTRPLQLAERLFGGPSHLVLLDDERTAVSFLGWRIGASVIECSEGGGATRIVTVEILYSRAGEYAVTERSTLRLADSASRLDATTVTLLATSRDVRRFCETATGDPVRDMVLAAALDHGARTWPSLRVA
jgi:hypothetical protein